MKISIVKAYFNQHSISCDDEGKQKPEGSEYVLRARRRSAEEGRTSFEDNGYLREPGRIVRLVE